MHVCVDVEFEGNPCGVWSTQRCWTAVVVVAVVTARERAVEDSCVHVRGRRRLTDLQFGSRSQSGLFAFLLSLLVGVALIKKLAWLAPANKFESKLWLCSKYCW